MEDITGVNDGCDVVLSPWVNNPAYLNPKYDAKPLSRFQESFSYATGQTASASSARCGPPVRIRAPVER